MNMPNEETRTSLWRVLCGLTGTEIDRINNKRFTIWCLAWAIAIVAATFLIKSFDSMPTALAWGLALVPNLLALGALVSYLRLLRMTDEMQRKIHVEGLAVGFGTGWIFALGYLVLEAVGAPELSVTAMVLVMTGGWMLGTFLAVRHYS